jgi:hypothetical protein
MITTIDWGSEECSAASGRNGWYGVEKLPDKHQCSTMKANRKHAKIEKKKKNMQL